MSYCERERSVFDFLTDRPLGFGGATRFVKSDKLQLRFSFEQNQQN